MGDCGNLQPDPGPAGKGSAADRRRGTGPSDPEWDDQARERAAAGAQWALDRWDFVGRRAKKWESADKPGSVVSNHPSGTHVAVRLKQPTRKPLRAAGTSPKARALPYLALLQVGFAVPPNVATGAVRSYRTLSPLPATTRLRKRLGRTCVRPA